MFGSGRSGRRLRCLGLCPEDVKFPPIFKFNIWIWMLATMTTMTRTVEGWKSGTVYKYKVEEVVPQKDGIGFSLPFGLKGLVYNYEQIFSVQAKNKDESSWIHVQGENFRQIGYNRYAQNGGLEAPFEEKKCSPINNTDFVLLRPYFTYSPYCWSKIMSYEKYFARRALNCDYIVTPMDIVLGSAGGVEAGERNRNYDGAQRNSIKAIRVEGSLEEWEVEIKKAQALDLLFRIPTQESSDDPDSDSDSDSNNLVPGNNDHDHDNDPDSQAHANFLSTREEHLFGLCPVTYRWRPVGEDSGNLQYFSVRPDGAPSVQKPAPDFDYTGPLLDFYFDSGTARSDRTYKWTDAAAIIYVREKRKAIQQMEEREEALTPEMFKRARDLCDEVRGQMVEVEKTVGVGVGVCRQNEKGDPPSLSLDPNPLWSGIPYKNKQGTPVTSPDLFGEMTLVSRYLVCKTGSEGKEGVKNENDLVTLHQHSVVVHRMNRTSPMGFWSGEQVKGLRRTMTLISITDADKHKNPDKMDSSWSTLKENPHLEVKNGTTITSFVSKLGPLNYADRFHRSFDDKRTKFWIVL